MIRAGIFIGVDRTGDLQPLNDAAEGARRMYQWALAQGMADGTHAKLITDANGNKVGPDQIYDAIEGVINGAGADQLIVYFAGHGINVNRNEVWLLTDAPKRAGAAVNVTGSVELARLCGIQHVVMISDACRVAADGIQAQAVRGQEVFPNDPVGDRFKPVDQFFACALGRPAVEVRDPAAAALGYKALYTAAMLDALGGAVSDVLEPAVPEDGARYVKPRRLEDYLEIEVPRRIVAMRLQNSVNQSPDAIILAHSNWLAKVDGARPEALPRGGPIAGVEALRPVAAESVRGVAESLVRSAAAGDSATLTRHLQQAAAAPAPGVREMARTVDKVAPAFGPDHFETQCGIKVRGASISDFLAVRAQGTLLANDLLRLENVEPPAASVLVRFQNGAGTVIPVIPDFLVALTVDGDELADVAYEPSANSPRALGYAANAPAIRALRAVAAAASRHGRFRLEGEDAEQVARQMQWDKGSDPALAVYASYAYHDLQQIDRIRNMAAHQEMDLGVALFDLRLLGRQLVKQAIDPQARVVPFVPMLAQGWALLRANRVKLHAALGGIEGNLRESLWSLYDDKGLDKLRAALQSREVR